MRHLLKAVSNRAHLALDALAGKKADAQLLYLLRELARARKPVDEVPDEIVSLLARGANPNAKSAWADTRNATDLALWVGSAVTQCLLEAGGKLGELGIGRMVALATRHMDCYDAEFEPFAYAIVVERCIRACPEAKWWYEVPSFNSYFAYTAISHLECVQPGITELLENARRACGVEGKRVMPYPVGQVGLDDALVRTLQNLEPDCGDTIDDDQRRERVETLLKLGASPNAATQSGRAMGCAINTLDASLVETLLSHGGQACGEDMVMVLNRRVGGVDRARDFKLQMRDEKEASALFNIVARCFPPNFSWDYDFKAKDWECDDIVVNMQSALSNYRDHLNATQEATLLGSGTPELATSGASRRL